MADRPILFSAPMVRALIDGRKTQTRRVLKLPTKTHSGGPIYERADMGGWATTTVGGAGCFSIDRATGQRISEPERAALWHQTTGTTMGMPYSTGDRLWVRESGIELPGVAGGAGDLFRHDVPNSPGTGVYWSRNNGGPGASYSVAGCPRKSALYGRAKVRPSIHMPRWASRLTLTVTDVRVERLQDCSEADALAEGIDRIHFPEVGEWGWPQRKYAEHWNSINGPGAWEANPFVVAVSFTVGRHNIDAEAPHV